MNAIAIRRGKKSRRLSLPFTHWSVLILTCLGMGNLPFSGRHHWGSFSVSLITPLLLWPFLGLHDARAALIACLISCLIGAVALEVVARKGIPEDHDSSAVVLDEFAGSALTVGLVAPLTWVLIGATTPGLQLLGLLYLGLMFRIFDLIKPWPASVFDLHWHHSFSVIADDLAAGVWAAAIAPLPFYAAPLIVAWAHQFGF